MSEPDRIPDEAFVVRCGLPPFKGRPLIIACDRHPEGWYGFSVRVEAGLTVEQLATACDNNWVGYTTAGNIRRMGYEIARTFGGRYHATVIVPENWSAAEAESLTRLFQPVRNPSPKRRR